MKTACNHSVNMDTKHGEESMTFYFSQTQYSISEFRDEWNWYYALTRKDSYSQWKLSISLFDLLFLISFLASLPCSLSNAWHGRGICSLCLFLSSITSSYFYLSFCLSLSLPLSFFLSLLRSRSLSLSLTPKPFPSPLNSHLMTEAISACTCRPWRDRFSPPCRRSGAEWSSCGTWSTGSLGSAGCHTPPIWHTHTHTYVHTHIIYMHTHTHRVCHVHPSSSSHIHTQINVTRSHKMVLKSILVATEILIYYERRGSADYYGEKIIVVSVKIKKLWRVKVSGSESSHFEKKQFKVVQHILGIFP